LDKQSTSGDNSTKIAKLVNHGGIIISVRRYAKQKVKNLKCQKDSLFFSKTVMRFTSMAFVIESVLGCH
jgi:hypothetical protein